MNAYDRLLLVCVALGVVNMSAHRCSYAHAVLLSWYVSALMHWSMWSGSWKLAVRVCELSRHCLDTLGVMVTLGMHLPPPLGVDPIHVC